MTTYFFQSRDTEKAIFLSDGLIRQYFPRKTRFVDVRDEDVKRVELLLNNRPRKVLDFETPLERFDKLSRNIVHSNRSRGYLKNLFI